MTFSYMLNKPKYVFNALRNEGPINLWKKSVIYLASHTSRGDEFLYNISLREIQKRMKEENDLNDILDTVLDIKPGYPPYQIRLLQLRDEIKELAQIVYDDNPQTILEIGTANGGSFYIWCRYLDCVNQIVSLDLPGGKFGGGYNQQKANIFEKFSPSIDLDFIRENSHNQHTLNKVGDILDEEIDFLFIDADHTYEGVKADFEMYSQLVSDGGLIAIHDIVHHSSNPEYVNKLSKNDVEGLEDRHLVWGESHPECNVDKFWSELKNEHETKEIISHPKQTWGGLGVIRL